MSTDINYVIASGDNRGKRLVRKMSSEIAKNGAVAVIAFSESGVQRTHNAIQRLSNESGQRLSVLPYSDVVNGVPVFTALVSVETDGAAIIQPAIDGDNSADVSDL
jgi:hypothetical protein